MKRRQLMFPSDLSDSQPAPRPVRRPGRGWDARYLIETTPSRLAHEAERGRELMAQLAGCAGIPAQHRALLALDALGARQAHL